MDHASESLLMDYRTERESKLMNVQQKEDIRFYRSNQFRVKLIIQGKE